MSLRIALVHLRTSRPHAPGFQADLDALNAGALAAVDALGGDADLIAASERPLDDVLDAVRAADAIVLLGGEDVDPARYGGAVDYPGSGHHEPASDEAHIAIVRDALRTGTPLLGICRGAQVLNVAFGGTLVQDHDGHRGAPGADPYVTTELAHEGPLAGVAAGEVLCTHHQSIGRVGDGLRVVARASDGIVEAVVHESAPITGVQWHPEHPAVAVAQLVPLLRRLGEQAALSR
ncbi:gamma-glutamyl-gamma-aminobutyrate hydrolase family protein [Microbacterium gilvum]|uniref:Glutamine amidotransferase n=1 Tax=Microbacterium gilvum TaxID=1336204 RepID=A0ABP9AMX4_9MICO